MKLYSSPASPFGRKVKMAILIKNLAPRVEILFADATKGDAVLNKANPLGRIPALLTDQGVAIFDSHVICEYLDTVGTSPELFPKAGDARWRTLTLAALADGMLDSALMLVYEKRFRPENMAVQGWIDRQAGKIVGALDHLEAHIPKWSGHPDYGHLTLACALGYLDFRKGVDWRPGHPKLVAWLADYAKAVPAFEATTPKDPPPAK